MKAEDNIVYFHGGVPHWVAQVSEQETEELNKRKDKPSCDGKRSQ